MAYESIAEATGFLRSIKKQVVKTDLLAARIAAQFSREDRFIPVDRVARDSVRVAALARAVQLSVPGKQRSTDFAKLVLVCSAYGARVVMRDTAAGVALNLQFQQGRYATRAGTLFHIT